MRELLGDEYEAFLDSYREPTRRGLRCNLLKVSNPRFYEPPRLHERAANTLYVCDQSLSEEGKGSPLPWKGVPPGAAGVVFGKGLTPIPWCVGGYEYPTDSRPSKSLLYNAGLFYIQEPSAMCPAAILRPQPGQRVLDLCAAPGGKSVQLAGYMQGRGLLVSNDASPSRSRALVKNLELSGVTNAVVLTEMPHRFVDRFEAFFDCILVDAPCSGEGMFRRDPDAVQAYTANKPEACATIQKEILHYAGRMLKPGGRIVYSTCTFNLLENEGTVAAFLEAHPDFELIPIDHKALGLSPGFAKTNGFSDRIWDGGDELCKTARIWPHKAPGEGHFIAHLMKKGDLENNNFNNTMHGKDKPPKEFLVFCEETLNIHEFTGETVPSITDGTFFLSNPDKSAIQRLYLQPEALNLNGLRVARSGWLLGECIKGRFTPSQALAMGITKDQARYSVDLPESEALRYLKGESLAPPHDYKLPSGKPWVLICYMGCPLGWARLVQGRLKNQLPTSWVVSL